MSDDFTPSKPAANLIWAKEPGGDIDFNDRETSLGSWPKKSKAGDTFLVGKCLCGRRCMIFMQTKEGWKIVKEAPQESKEEW